MTRVAQRIEDGRKVYLTDAGKWTPDKSIAKEFKGQFWIELLKILVDLIRIFGVTNIKYVKR